MKTSFFAVAAGLAVVLAACASAATPAPTAPSATPSEVLTAPPTASPVPTPRPSPPIDPVSVPLECRIGAPLDLVVHPERYTVDDACRSATGTVLATSHAPTGQLVLSLRVDYGSEAGLLLPANLSSGTGMVDATFECVSPISDADAIAACGTRTVAVAPPATGAHVIVTGTLVHPIAGGARAIVHLRGLTLLPYGAQQAPLSVLQTQRVWALIRATWPAIPPLIVTADYLGGGSEASASLGADGLAYLSVQLVTAPTDHEVWHEAGHILQAVADRARGSQQQLFGPTDPVGISFWSARGLPGQWADHIGNLGWALTGYEEFAECFAATNLGDVERTETWNVPLDRSAMKRFFATLVPGI